MTMCMEITGPKTRALIAVLCSAAYTSGVLLLGLMAYFVRSWRHLSLYSSVPLAIIFVVLYNFFPESPRWLLMQGKYGELEQFLRKVARVNKRPLESHFDESLPNILRLIHRDRSTKTHTIFDVVRFPNMRKKTLILVFINFCNKGVFLGLNYYAPGFGGDPHWNFFLTNVIEMPPYIFAEFVCDRIGRRLSLFLGMIVGSIAGLVAVMVPGSSLTAILLLSLTAKFCITFTYLIAELVEEEASFTKNLAIKQTKTVSGYGILNFSATSAILTKMMPAV